MSLDANVKAMLDQMKAMALPKMWELGPEAARAAMRMHLSNSRERLRRAHEAASAQTPAQVG